MLSKNQVIKTLRTHQDELQNLGIKHLYLFGSIARGDETLDSDVDLAIELDSEAKIGWEFFRFEKEISNLLNCTVDLGTINSLRPSARKQFEKEKLHVF